MDRRRVVLAGLLACGANAEFTPIQIQKLFFLLDRDASHLLGGPHFDFRPHDYRPYDRAVYDTLADLKREGFVSTRGGGEAGSYRMYMATQKGFSAGREALESMQASARTFVGQAAEWVKSLEFAQLVSAIYSKYPDLAKNSVVRR